MLKNTILSFCMFQGNFKLVKKRPFIDETTSTWGYARLAFIFCLVAFGNCLNISQNDRDFSYTNTKSLFRGFQKKLTKPIENYFNQYAEAASIFVVNGPVRPVATSNHHILVCSEACVKL